jgi:DNA-binding transcriptional ArsR family regulator
MDICSSFKALGDPVRVSILKALCCERLCVGDIVGRVNLSQPAVSHHLRILREAGLVNAEKEGTTVFYSLNKDNVNTLCCDVRDEFEVE